MTGKEIIMSKIKIFVDTAADMSAEVREKYDIDVINFLCIFDGESFVAGEELSNEAFYEKLAAAKNIPTTSQTPPAVMYETLKKAAEENDAVVYFALSSKASGQYNNACLYAREIMEENPNLSIKIVDTMSFSIYISETAVAFRKYTDAGMDIESAIEKALKFIDYHQVYILVDDLSFLQKGGRITKTTAIVGNLLDIKPVLTVSDGLVEPLEKIRGKKKVYNKLAELILENPDFDDEAKELYVIGSNPDYCDKLEDVLKEEFEIDDIVRRYEIGPIIGTHIGNGAVAVVFRKKGYNV